MFPAWEADELAALLSEHHDDVEIVIDLIVNNKVSKWEPIKKEPKPKKREEVITDLNATQTSHAHNDAKPKHLRERADQAI